MSKRTNTCQIDHSPERDAPDASAPNRNIGHAGISLAGAVALKSRRLSAIGAAPRSGETRVTDVREVWRRIRAAVALEVAESDRDDAQADLYADLLAEARSETGNASDAPRRERVRMQALRWRARDWERARAPKRAELAAETAMTGLASVDLAGSAGDTGAPEWTPGQARAGAAQLCELLGLSTGGKIETAMYVYLRGATPLETVASETGHTAAGLRVALSHGRKLIRAAYPDPRALLAALLLIDPPARDARHGGLLKQHRRDCWRDRADAIAADVRYGHAVPTRLPMSAARRTHLARGARRASFRDPRRALALRNAGSHATPNR